MVSTAIKFIFDDDYRSIGFKQGPNHVEIVGANVADGLIDPADGQEPVPPEQQKVPDIAGAFLQRPELVIDRPRFGLAQYNSRVPVSSKTAMSLETMSASCARQRSTAR